MCFDESITVVDLGKKRNIAMFCLPKPARRAGIAWTGMSGHRSTMRDRESTIPRTKGGDLRLLKDMYRVEWDAFSPAAREKLRRYGNAI